MKSLLIFNRRYVLSSMATLLLLTTVFYFSSCKKEVDDLVASKNTVSLEELASTSRVVDFTERMNSKTPESLELRTTYTLTDFIDLTTEGMAYEYTTASSTIGTTYTYQDTISVTFGSSTAITEAEASVIYNSISSKASEQARRVGIAPIYFFGLAISSYSVTSISANLILRGTYIDGDPQGTTGSSSIPEGRHFYLNQKCSGGTANSAALEIQNWVNSLQPPIGLSSNQYISVSLFTTAGSISAPEYSAAMVTDCKTLNPSDPTSGDGSVDTRSFYFLCPDASCTGVDLTQVECISPTEYAYHAPQVNSIFNAEKTRRGANYIRNLQVYGYDGNILDGVTTKRLKKWNLSGWALKIRTVGGPVPGKDILE